MKKLFMLMCLPLLMAGCSKDNDDIDPGDPEIPGENASDYVEFKGGMQHMTRFIMNDDSIYDAILYAWCKFPYEAEVKMALGVTREVKTDLMYYTYSFLRGVDPDYVTMSRNHDDPSVWNYTSKLKWTDPLSKDGLSFLAVCGTDDKEVYLSQITSRHRLVRSKNCIDYDAMNGEYTYSSGHLSDVMVAYALDCRPADYKDSVGYKEVELNFNHIFPRLTLNAKLEDNCNSLDVEVAEAYIFGLQLNGWHNIESGKSLGQDWTSSDNLNTYIQMDLSQPKKLGYEYSALVDEGCEPHVLPQKVKSWTSFANHNGAGILLKARIKNLNDNSWIAGDSEGYELVYSEFPFDELKMGKIYDINLIFGPQYRENGHTFSYRLSYQPTIVDWNEESENVELYRK